MKTQIHQNQPIHQWGAPLEQAQGVVIALHGRGASSVDMQMLTRTLNVPHISFYAPTAAGNTWYPQRFISPIKENEPYLSSALDTIDQVIAHLVAQGMPHEKILLMGFSQGACLSAEYVARHPRRYGGVAILSGGLIGESITEANYQGDLSATPILNGCGDQDFHIPLERVQATTTILQKLGASVDERIYPQMGHIVHPDELGALQQMLDNL
ncbi:MAG: alpha/beta hydrolase [Phototrophicaceae bacterium]